MGNAYNGESLMYGLIKLFEPVVPYLGVAFGILLAVVILYSVRNALLRQKEQDLTEMRIHKYQGDMQPMLYENTLEFPLVHNLDELEEFEEEGITLRPRKQEKLIAQANRKNRYKFN